MISILLDLFFAFAINRQIPKLLLFINSKSFRVIRLDGPQQFRSRHVNQGPQRPQFTSDLFRYWVEKEALILFPIWGSASLGATVLKLASTAFVFQKHFAVFGHPLMFPLLDLS